ncbi:MAG: hypothetical protein IH631_10755 [Candidatus Thorarchaeota archaeon]|nr:hypothetical protein [Candidatus Thorarchaeota archaeon]
MGKLLKVTRDFNLDDFLAHELNWLKRCMSKELKGKISEDKIIFTPKGSYLKCIPSKEVMKDVPTRFLESKLLVESISEQELHNGFFVSLDVLFWYIQNVSDVWGYKKLTDPLFYEVFYGEHIDYDKPKKGYRILDKHLEKVCKGWAPIEKTLFIGYLQFLRLLKDKTVPPLSIIIEELKKGTMKDYGLTKASKESFGKMAHRQLLGVCWNCGDDAVLPNGLCRDCDEYWDEKTR